MPQLSLNFHDTEARCKCRDEHCSALLVPPEWFIRDLQRARFDYGQPMRINSWIRCAYWNEKIRGAPRSWHLKGIAVDIACSSSRDRWGLVSALIRNRFTVSIYSTWVHADRRPGSPILLRGKK